MSIRINQERCIGCGQCMTSARAASSTATTRARRGCIIPRTVGAVCPASRNVRSRPSTSTSRDMGGRGSTMNVTADGHYLHWHIHKPTGRKRPSLSTENRQIRIESDRENASIQYISYLSFDV